MNYFCRIFFLGLLAGVSMPGLCFTCYLTLVKDNCWLDYRVNVDVTNVDTDTKLFTMVVPEGKKWSRTKFECQAREMFQLQSSFTPVFWAGDAGKTYPSARNWSLPEAVTGGAIAWNINICYASDFTSVPMPPDASGACHCDLNGVPKVAA